MCNRKALLELKIIFRNWSIAEKISLKCCTEKQKGLHSGRNNQLFRMGNIK